MDPIKQARINKAKKYFSKQFIDQAAIDPITAYVYLQVINGNAYKVIELLTARVNDQAQTITGLMEQCTPDYKSLLNSS